LEYLRRKPEYDGAIRFVESFIQMAEPVIGTLEDKAVDTPIIQNLLQKANEEASVIRELTNVAGVAVYEEIEVRNTTIQEQESWIFALIYLQWVVFLVALMATTVYIRRQRVQNLNLVNMTHLLRTTSQKAEEATQAKSVFLANMSHELRTPFQGMVGMLDLLSATPLSEVQKDYAHIALNSSRHLLGILNDILDISSIESGSLKLRTEPMHLRNLIKDVQALMTVVAHAKNIDLRVEVDHALPQWIEADEMRLSQILFNLLSNAIKFTDSGHVSLKLAVSTLSYPNTKIGLCLTVDDSGIGMDEKTLLGLFSRFHQADQSIHRRFGGTGLGLEISYNLVKLMDSTITVKSTLGVGSTFKLEIPLYQAAAPTVPLKKVISSHRSLNVLVVDDHPVNIKYLTYLLEKMGHQTISFENGKLALEAVQNNPVDVILMDMHMPVMDGIAATQAIRKLGAPIGDVKIIMVSADVLSDTRRMAFKAGVNDFITKPVQADGLRQALERCFFEAADRLDTPSHEIIDVKAYQEFLNVMPVETSNNQLDELFGNDEPALTKISESLKAGNRIEANELVHRIMGVCMLMGFTAMVGSLKKIESALLDTANEWTPSILDQLHIDAQATRLAVAEFSVTS
jgi:signal transduction histidine kinase/FixJ family two-component response regulator